MTDAGIYRWSGASALAAIAVFLVEFPFYMVRGTFPAVSDGPGLIAFTARNATNIMTCMVLDFAILTLILIFAAGLRHLIRQADAQYEWVATLFFGVCVVYVTLTLAADGMQAATAVDALTPPADGTVIRTLIEGMFLLYGSFGLFFMAVLMAAGGYAGAASQALPRWSAWVGYVCALACLAFVPSMFVGHPDLMGFYNPAGWGPEAIALGVPLAVWMVVTGVLMMKLPDAGSR